MTKYIVKANHLNRDEFLTPFDTIFDQLMAQQFPTFQSRSAGFRDRVAVDQVLLEFRQAQNHQFAFADGFAMASGASFLEARRRDRARRCIDFMA